MFNIGMVGAGAIGLLHKDAIVLNTECKLVAVCDCVIEKAIKLVEGTGARAYADYIEMQEKENLDAVIVNLPHFLHERVTVYFLEKGVSVLVEKPMANSVEECDRMIAAAGRSGKKLAIGHCQRFFGVNRVVKEIYESGELGKLCMITEHRSSDYFEPDRPRWFLDKKKAGGGIVMNYGAHALDKMFYIMGSDPVCVNAIIGNAKNDYDIEGHAQIFIKFANDVSASITLNAYTDNDYESRYYFTQGALKTNGINVWKNTGSGWEDQKVTEEGFFLSKQLEEFVKYIKGEPSLVVTGEYSREIIAAIEKIYGV